MAIIGGMTTSLRHGGLHLRAELRHPVIESPHVQAAVQLGVGHHGGVGQPVTLDLLEIGVCGHGTQDHIAGAIAVGIDDGGQFLQLQRHDGVAEGIALSDGQGNGAHSLLLQLLAHGGVLRRLVLRLLPALQQIGGHGLGIFAGEGQHIDAGIALLLGVGADGILVIQAAAGAIGRLQAAVQVLGGQHTVEGLLADAHQGQLLLIALLAVKGHQLLPLESQGGHVSVGEGDALLLCPGAGDGKALGGVHRLQLYIVAVGDAALGHGGVPVHVRQLARQIGTDVVHPIEVLLTGDDLTVDDQHLAVRVKAAGLIQQALSALTALHAASEGKRAHQHDGHQRARQKTDPVILHVLPPQGSAPRSFVVYLPDGAAGPLPARRRRPAVPPRAAYTVSGGALPRRTAARGCGRPPWCTPPAARRGPPGRQS